MWLSTDRAWLPLRFARKLGRVWSGAEEKAALRSASRCSSPTDARPTVAICEWVDTYPFGMRPRAYRQNARLLVFVWKSAGCQRSVHFGDQQLQLCLKSIEGHRPFRRDDSVLRAYPSFDSPRPGSPRKEPLYRSLGTVNPCIIIACRIHPLRLRQDRLLALLPPGQRRRWRSRIWGCASGIREVYPA